MLVLILIVLMASPALAQEAILLNVNQTHTLQWDWQQGDRGPVREFVFQCQQFRKELEADARRLTFRSLIDEPGRYTGCTLAAKNEVGLSAPVIVPDFEYAYSYGTLGWLLLEGLAGLGTVAALIRPLVRRVSRAKPLALPEPVIILQKEHDHAYRA